MIFKLLNDKLINLETGKVVLHGSIAVEKAPNVITYVVIEDFVKENYQELDPDNQIYGLPFVYYKER